MFFITHNIRGRNTPLDGFVYYPVDPDYIREDIKLLANETVRSLSSPSSPKIQDETEENILVLIDCLTKKWIDEFEIWNYERLRNSSILDETPEFSGHIPRTFDERMLGIINFDVATVFGYQFTAQRGVIVNPPLMKNIQGIEEILEQPNKRPMKKIRIINQK